MGQPIQRGIGASWLAAKLAAASLTLAASVAAAQPGPDGFDWIRITQPNNPAYAGPDPDGYVTGRGSVPYEYRIGRDEVTTAQWLEFFNAALARPDPVPFVNPGIAALLTWGASRDGSYTGPGVRYQLNNQGTAGMRPTYGVPWRTAAVFCNWLHNGKSSAPAAFLSGAYDVSTFRTNPDGTFTDQVTRSTGARYWIPSLDEWIKAAHWSPDKPTDDGWYQYSTGSDVPLTYGPPPAFGGDGTGQANSLFNLPNFAEYRIPLGSYPNTPSIWGTRDMAGCASEWTEETFDSLRYRLSFGSNAGGFGGDRITSPGGGDIPTSNLSIFGLRLASPVASPGGCGILGLFVCISHHTARRRSHEPHRSRSNCSARVRGGGSSFK